MRRVARMLLMTGLLTGTLSAQVPTSPPQTPPPGGQATQTQGSAIPLTEYKVGPHDVLRIAVFQQALFPGLTYSVAVDGTIFFYASERLRAVQVAGLTTQAIQQVIKAGLIKDGLFPMPAVIASVEVFHSQSFTISGQVRNPNTYRLGADQMTLQNALNAAGGVTSDAGPDVLVRRPKVPGVPGTLDPDAINASTEQKSFNREELDNGKIDPPPILQDGDFIYVPKAQRVNVLGEVQSPGLIMLLPGMTVIQAIQKAGGFKDSASRTRFEIMRYDPKQGNYVSVKDVTTTTLLQANDSLTVKKKIML